MTAPVSSARLRYARGFTLIELLTVIAIIGILAAITIPTVSGVREKARKTKTRIQFGQWAQAISTFKNAYGFLPRFPTDKVNGDLTYSSTSMVAKDYLFRELITGQGTKDVASVMEFQSDEKNDTTKQNKKRRNFVSFDAGQLSSKAEGDAVDGALKDTFGNVEIAVVLDRTGDGFINDKDLNGSGGYPELTAKDNRGTLRRAGANGIINYINNADSTQRGVRAEVIFYSPGSGNSSGGDILPSDAVWSW